MIDEAVFQILLADTTANDLFGGRFYMREAPEFVTLPYVVRSEVSGSRYHTLNGAGAVARELRQISVFAATEAAAIAGREAIRDALDGFSGTITLTDNSAVEVMSALSSNFGDIDDEGSEPRVFGKYVEFSFIWRVPPPDPDALTYIDRAGITTPAYIAGVLALVPRLKGLGIWSKLDWLNLYAANDQITGAAKNAVRNDFHSTFFNVPTFTAGHGVTFANNRYAMVDYNPRVDAINCQLNATTLFGWAETYTGPFPGDAGALMGSGSSTTPQAASRLRPSYNTDSTPGFDVNNGNTAASASISQANYIGFYLANRTASNLVTLRKNGIQIASSTTASTALPGPYWMVGGVMFDNAFPGEPFPGQVSVAGMGSLTNAEADNLYIALSEFRSVIGL